MFDHVTIRVSERRAAEHFYETVLRTLDAPTPTRGDFIEWDEFSIAEADADKPVTRGLHIGFVAPSREHVDAFWRAGTTAGYRTDGEPGLRPQYRDDYYGAFLLDNDGNSIEAVHHGAPRQGGLIDHLWIRVPDLPAATRFYELVAPHAGFRLNRDLEERAQFLGESGSFSLVDGTPTENLHMAFGVAGNDAVGAFHRALTVAGYPDNGGPRERREYHPGYYAAFVLDPAGHNVELVNHNRP